MFGHLEATNCWNATQELNQQKTKTDETFEKI